MSSGIYVCGQIILTVYFIFSIRFLLLCKFLFFFFKQKTAYELRISDWSSDVCSSDLGEDDAEQAGQTAEASARHGSTRDRAGGEAGYGDLHHGEEDGGGPFVRLDPGRQRAEQEIDRAKGDELQDQDRKSTRLNSSH